MSYSAAKKGYLKAKTAGPLGHARNPKKQNSTAAIGCHANGQAVHLLLFSSGLMARVIAAGSLSREGPPAIAFPMLFLLLLQQSSPTPCWIAAL